LTKSLSNTATRASDQPSVRLRYNLPEKERAEIRDRGGDMEDEFELDFPIKLARDLAGRLNPGKRMDEVRSAKDFLDKLQVTEVAVADEVAAAADLARGKAEGVPAVLVRGLDLQGEGTAREIVIEPELDLFL